MPKLNRPSWGGYYKTKVGEPENLLMGCEILHSYHCGTFELDGVKYNLMFFILFKDSYPDTKGKYQESFDFAGDDADAICSHPIFTSASEDMDLSFFAPSVQQLIYQDIQGGLDMWEIMNIRLGVIVTHFMEFTFAGVQARYPDILQQVEHTDEDGNTYYTNNIWRCSLEDEA